MRKYQSELSAKAQWIIDSNLPTIQCVEERLDEDGGPLEVYDLGGSGGVFLVAVIPPVDRDENVCNIS